jgi:hypothetical protein
MICMNLKPMATLIVSCLLFGASSVTLAAVQASSSADLIELDRVEEGTLYFKLRTPGSTPPSASLAPPNPLKSGLFELTSLGVLRPPKGQPFFLFTGKPCPTCMEEKAVYIIRPNPSEKPLAFVYPGKIIDPKTRGILLDSRSFYGRCLPHHGDIYVTFQKEKVDRRNRLQASVLIAEAAQEHLTETLIERRLPQVKTALQYVKRKTCKEIPGRNRFMLAKPLDLHPKNVNDQDDDDDEPANKENETTENESAS